jgi:hypothetical protein
MALLWIGGEGPEDVSGWVYVHLVTKLEVPAEQLSGLRMVQRAGFWEDKPVTFFRIYDPEVDEEARQVKDFTSLDERQELILYEGYVEKESDRVFLECKTKPKPRS